LKKVEDKMARNNSRDRFMRSIYRNNGTGALKPEPFEDGGPTREDQGLPYYPKNAQIDYDGNTISIRGPWIDMGREDFKTAQVEDYSNHSTSKLLSEMEDQNIN